MQRNGSSRSLPGDGPVLHCKGNVLSSRQPRSARDLRRELRRERSKLTIRTLSASHIQVDIDFDGGGNRIKRYREHFSPRRQYVAQGVVVGICIAYLVFTVQGLYGRVATLPVDRHTNIPSLLRSNSKHPTISADDTQASLHEEAIDNPVLSLDTNTTSSHSGVPVHNVQQAELVNSSAPQAPSMNATEGGNSEENVTTEEILLPQPFTGAKDAQGRFGFVANTSTPALETIFDNDADMESACSVKPGGGIEGKGGWNTLVNNVVVDITADRHPRVLCTIYTHSKNHDRVAAIAKTWGSKCDGFWAASTETDESINAVNLSHEGDEAYSNMWQKTRSILAYDYKNFIDDFDYFYVAGDDTYLIAENLRKYLLEYEDNPQSPYLFAGHYMIKKSLYIGGGGGYVINREALKKFVEGGGLENCYPHSIDSAEDRFMSNCMKREGIPLADTADSHGRQRFFSRDPDWFGKFKGKGGPFVKVYELWERQHGPKKGASIISASAISFHLIKGPKALKRLHAILYRSCPFQTLVAKSINKAIL